MPEIIRRRTIRPSTRKDSSVNYRVDINGIAAGDTLVEHIEHENNLFNKTFKFKGADVLKKKRLGFKVQDHGTGILINWKSTQPIKGLQ